MSLFNSSLWCWLFGHRWNHLPDAIPEDRESYRCKRCDETSLHPPSVGMTMVPEDQRVNHE